MSSCRPVTHRLLAVFMLMMGLRKMRVFALDTGLHCFFRTAFLTRFENVSAVLEIRS